MPDLVMYCVFDSSLKALVRCQSYRLVMCQVSLPKIDTSGEYSPLKISLRDNTCDNHTGRNAGEHLSSLCLFLLLLVFFSSSHVHPFFYHLEAT